MELHFSKIRSTNKNFREPPTNKFVALFTHLADFFVLFVHVSSLLLGVLLLTLSGFPSRLGISRSENAKLG
jgi:hypothetical protein